jgi:polysaccharide export outer membrane protein
MKMSLKIVVAIAWAAALCAAQTDPAPSSGIPPVSPQAAPATTPPTAPAATPKEPAAGPTAPAAASPTRNIAPEGKVPAGIAPYVIGPLDVLAIKVWNNQNLSALYDVRLDGMLSMPLIGEVKAEGLTVQALKDLLTDEDHIGKIMVEPIVDIQVAKVNSKRYFVYGEVLRTGEVPLIETTTILDAVASFGGFKDFAKTNKIYLMRGTEKHLFNYKDVSKGKHMEQNIVIQNGDRIYVP